MKCPKCKLENPPRTSRCDCGWDFTTNTKEASYLPSDTSASKAGVSTFRRIRAIGLLIALLLMGAGILKTYFGVVRPLRDTLHARSWEQARVVSGRAKIIPFHGIAHVHFEYVYEYHGRRYTGNRYSFVHPTYFMAEAALFAMQDGLPAVCYVDPLAPTRAVIDRELPWSAYRYTGIYVLLAGFFVLVWLRLFRQDFGTAARTARIVTRAVGVVLTGWAVVRLSHATSGVHFAVAGLGIIAPAMSLLWLNAAALRVSAVWFCLVSIIGSCLALNPFALMDVSTDDVHDPGFVAEQGVNILIFTVALWTLAFAAATVAAIAHPPPGIGARRL
jgi:hypothetical protein